MISFPAWLLLAALVSDPPAPEPAPAPPSQAVEQVPPDRELLEFLGEFPDDEALEVSADMKAVPPPDRSEQ